MRVFEGQTLGALSLLIVSLAVYGISALNAQKRQPVWESQIPWGCQGTGFRSVEITGDLGQEGIYFVPDGTTIDRIRKIAMIPEMNNGKRIEDMAVSDGSVIMTSERGEVRIGQMSAARRLSLGLPVHLNQASVADLTLIPGIGEKMARQIIELREQKGTFQDLSDLTAVPGIKIRKLNGLKEYLIVGHGP